MIYLPGTETPRLTRRSLAPHPGGGRGQCSVVSSRGGPFSPPSLHDVDSASLSLSLSLSSIVSQCFLFPPSLRPQRPSFFCRAVARCSSRYHWRREKRDAEIGTVFPPSPFSLSISPLLCPDSVNISFDAGKVSQSIGRFRQLSLSHLSPLSTSGRTKAIQFALQNFTPSVTSIDLGDDDDKRSISGSNLGYPAPRGKDRQTEREREREREPVVGGRPDAAAD